MKSSQRKWNDSNMDSWENETFYETANKVFVSMKQHIKSRNYSCHATEVISKLPTLKFNAVNHDVVKDEFSFTLKSVQNSDITPTFLISDNDNTSGRISKISNMSCAKDTIVQQIPKFCSL